jgi:hypothetical protein
MGHRPSVPHEKSDWLLIKRKDEWTDREWNADNEGIKSLSSPRSHFGAGRPTAFATKANRVDLCSVLGVVERNGFPYAARSFTSAEVADRAQWAQQKNRPPTSIP